MNLDYLPPWNNMQLGDITAGNPELGIIGLGAKSIRPGLQDKVLDRFGTNISVNDFEYYESLGMSELTAIVGFPSDDNRDWAGRFCGEGDKWNTLFKGIYEPIWDGGANGTPYDDRNLFAKYMYETVDTYKDYVRFWEIWNEPGLYKGNDAQVFWGQPDYPGSWWVNDPDPCDYSIHAPIEHFVRTLRIAYEVIKTVAPDDYVVLAGVGSQSFLDAVLRNTDEPTSGRVTSEFPHGGGAYFDVLGFHTYPHLDGSVFNRNEGFAKRHSDGAADGVIDRRLRGYQEVLERRGYDGRTYPRKEHIATEINVPRISVRENYLGSEQVQINFMAKAMIALKINRVHQMHVFSVSDRKPIDQIDFEFDAMGMYEYLPSSSPYNQRLHEAGKAYKTASDFIYASDYDEGRTAALNAPDGVRAYAFRRDDGSYVYALWAETRQDESEEASATYQFSSSLVGGDGTLTEHAWDYAYSQRTSSRRAGESIRLDGRPIFITAGSDEPLSNEAPSVSLSSAATNVDAGGNVRVRVLWSESVTGLLAGDFRVTNGQVIQLTGSGSDYRLELVAGSSGPLNVSLPAGAARDNEGLASLASSRLSIAINTDDPDEGDPDEETDPDGGEGIDLELSMTSDLSSINIYEHVTFRLELKNAGSQGASGVSVAFPKPADYAFTSSDISRGSYSDWTGNWKVGDVAPGQTVVAEISLFSLTGDARTAFAEVSDADQADSDSSPGNADGFTPREDDEARVVINGDGSEPNNPGDDNDDDDDDDNSGEPANGVDLSLELASAKTSYRIYERIPYTVTLRNSGNATAEDVVVDFPFPDGIVHTSNSTSSGSFGVWSQTWKVGDIAAGATATLQLDLYPLRGEGSVDAFVQVSRQAGPSDVDSSPGNAINNVVREDDEASLSLAPASAGSNGEAIARASLVLHEVHTSAVPNSYFASFTTRLGATATAQLVDGLGRSVRSFELSGTDGTHVVEIPTTGLPSGTYYLMVVTAGRARALPLVIVE